MGDGIRQSREVRLQLCQRRFQLPAPPVPADLAQHVDFRQAQPRQHRHHPPLGRTQRRHGAVAWQPLDVVGKPRQLVDHGARIGVVGQQQVQHRRALQRREVARAVGDRAVADLQQRLQNRPFLFVHLDQGAAQQARGVRGALEPPPEVQKMPLRAANHVLFHQAAERRQHHDGVIDQRQGIGQAFVIGKWAPVKILLQVRDDAPRFEGQVIPHRGRHAVQGAEHGAHAVGGLRVEQDCQQRLRPRSQALRLFPWRRQMAEPPRRQGAKQHREGRAGLQPGFVVEPDQQAAQQPHQPLGALAVAADPEQVVSRAAGKIVAAAAQRNRLTGRRQQRQGVRLPLAQHPGILAAAIVLH